ncbi:MAG: suppressor of fused domain protein [Bradyrhizobiaceae bacterium]|nr:suppressor of fused domain protein [Bradyrhizobiaceae bacterium]
MAETLLEEVNPNGNIQAVVESDDDSCYFYLFSPRTQQGMKSVWVRNHTQAPAAIEVERMRSGSPSRNPACHCRHTSGRKAPAAEDLRVVWLPEGNGAALYERDEVLAIIPPWSGTKGFHGYARDNIGQGPVAWELRSDNVLFERFKQAQSYWQKWEDQEFWPSVQSSQISQLEKVLGRHAKYYAIDGGKWPPKAIVCFAWEDRTVLVTVGVALRPQPNVEMATETPEQLRRIELGAVLPGEWSEEAVQRIASYVSGQSNLPWSNYTWFGPGHTLPCDSWQNPDHTMALLRYEHSGTPRIALEPFLSDPVKVLWFVPISDEERQIAIDQGSEYLTSRLPRDRWKQA